MVSELYIEQIKKDLREEMSKFSCERPILLAEAAALIDFLQDVYREKLREEAKEIVSVSTEAKDKLVCVDMSELALIFRREELHEEYLLALKEAAYKYFILTGVKSVTLTFNPYTKDTSMEDPIAITRTKLFRRK